jgi:hypothetical protein
MRLSKLLILWMTFAMAAFATTFSFTDPYGGKNNSGSNNGDVIGALAGFDIQSVSVNIAGTAVTLTLNFNYNNGNTDLNTSNTVGGVTLKPGDVLFTSGSSHWAVPLVTHGVSNAVTSPQLAAGNLYLVTGVNTAQTVLGNPGGLSYRNGAEVWGNPIGAVKTNSGTGTVSPSSLGGNELQVLVNFTADSAFASALNGGNFSLSFASATCGNDVITGVGTPEPLSLSLMGSGLLALGLVGRKRLGRK